MKVTKMFDLGARNLLRHRRRSMFAISIISFAVAAILFTGAWRRGMLDLIEREGASTWLGAVQVQPRGGLEVRDAFALTPSLEVAAMKDALREVPGISAMTPRVRFLGSMIRGQRSAPFVGLATDLATAPAVVPRLLEAERLEAGKQLTPGRSDQIVVAAPLAASLGLTVGSTVTLIAVPADGGLEGADVEVVGILRAAFQEDQKRATLVDLALAQRMLRLEGRATHMLLAVEPLSMSHQVAGAITSKVGESMQVEAHAWDEVNRRYEQARAIWNLSLGVVLIVVALVAALGVSTTLLLVVGERTREIGTLAALGLRRRSIAAMFMVEGSMLGVLGGLGGVMIAGALVAWAHHRGIAFTPPGGFTVQVRPALDARDLLIALTAAAVVTTVVTFFPARRAAGRPPVESLVEV